MTIRKTTAGTYCVEVFYPKDVRDIIGNNSRKFKKTVKTQREANRLEREVQGKIDDVRRVGTSRPMDTKGTIHLEDFYRNIWWPIYTAGGSGRVRRVPTKATQVRTEVVFRKHIIPMFGQYSLNYLNEHKEFVIEELTILSETYANIKTVKSYIRQLFDVAEMMDYIEFNRIEKALSFVGSPKKQRLQEKREAEGESLTVKELLAWIKAAKDDYRIGKLTEDEYLLFILTLNLGDRKSETYGLRWRYVDLDEGNVFLVKSLLPDKTLGPTKGRKQTRVQIPEFLVEMLATWKKHQAEQLSEIGITGLTSEQFVFTYTDFRGHTNVPLHPDFLNHRMKSIRHRHPELAKASPHKLRHTFSTLAREGGATMESISAALTHSDVSTTRIYVNTPDTVDLTVNTLFRQRIEEARKNSMEPEAASTDTFKLEL